MGPRDGLDWCKKSSPPPGLNPRTFQTVASRYTICAIPVKTRGKEAQIHLFLASAQDGDEWLTSSSGRFTPGTRPDTHRTRDWVDSRGGVDLWIT
jgi:hypothetical protein